MVLTMPTYRMPDSATRRRVATLAEMADALGAARSAARLAGCETHDFLVRELLLALIGQIDRATAALRRLC